MPVPEAIKAWAAGFYDGEGAVNISLQSSRHWQNGVKYTHYRMRLQISQIDPQPLKKLQSYWGGTITMKQSKGNQRAINTWCLRSREAKKFILDLYQYSQRDSVKRRFDVALQFQEEASVNRGKNRTAAYTHRMERLRLKLKNLNTRGLGGELYEQRPPIETDDPQLSLTLGRAE